MTTHPDRWLATEEVAQRLGMSSEWVRRQIIAGRLRAVAYETGGRRTYRVRETWVREFLVAYQITRFDDR
ncbi:MAG TPA: excisionase family DNA-binding protein [Candidatus Limnocylindrales bacterium]